MAWALAAARGALRGLSEGRRDKEERAERARREERQRRQDELEELATLDRIRNTPGYEIVDPEDVTPAVPAPIARPQIDYEPPPMPRIGETPAPGKATTTITHEPPPANPRSALEVARRTIGGREKVVTYDPSKSRDAQNQAAHTRLMELAGDAAGVYDPQLDYRALERKEKQIATLATQLAATGRFEPAEAEMLARHNIDLQERDRKTAADVRAEARETRNDQRAEATETRDAARLKLEERRVSVAERRAAGTGGGSTTPESRRALAAVAGQIDDTARDLAAARRAVPVKPAVFHSDADEAAFTIEHREAVAAVRALQARADSLNKVRDGLAAGAGGRPAAAPPSNPAGNPADSGMSKADRNKMDAEFARAAALYRELLAKPGIDKAKAKAAYDDTVRLIAQRYGAKV